MMLYRGRTQKLGVLLLTLLLILAVSVSNVFAAWNPQADADNRKKVNALVVEALNINRDGAAGYLWETGNKYYDIVTKLNEALQYEPYRIDIMHNIGAAYVLGNYMLNANYVTKNIIPIYEEILKYSPSDVRALANVAYWRHAASNLGEYGAGSAAQANVAEPLARLEKIAPYKAEQVSDLLSEFDVTFKSEVWNKSAYSVIKSNRTLGNLAIFTLGNALNPDGSMTGTMLNRLEETLKNALMYPNAKIVVSGGVPRAGTNEGVEMKKWLIENGIDENRIFTENFSTDTVSNMVYSRALLDQQDITDVILISSSTHVRRARILFKATCVTNSSDFNVQIFASVDPTDDPEKVLGDFQEPTALSAIYAGAARAMGDYYINMLYISNDGTDYNPAGTNSDGTPNAYYEWP